MEKNRHLGKGVTIGAAQFNVTRSIRIDHEMVQDLKDIALYEKTKTGTLLRMWTEDKIQVYRQNPAFKRWRKELNERRGR